MTFISKIRQYVNNLSLLPKELGTHIQEKLTDTYSIAPNIQKINEFYNNNINHFQKIRNEKQIKMILLSLIAPIPVAMILAVLSSFNIIPREIYYSIFMLVPLSIVLFTPLVLKKFEIHISPFQNEFTNFQTMVCENIFSDKKFQIDILQNMSDKIKNISSININSSQKLQHIYCELEELFIKHTDISPENYQITINHINSFETYYQQQLEYYKHIFEENNFEYHINEKIIGAI